MTGDAVRGGPFRPGSEDLKTAVQNAKSIFLWERKVENLDRRKKKTGLIDLMDATSMDRGSMKCINDARGLNLCSGKKVKNNVTMEPDGTISINSEARLFSLTQAGRPSLSQIEYFMDYGEAYFEKPTSRGGGGKGVVRLGGTSDHPIALHTDREERKMKRDAAAKLDVNSNLVKKSKNAKKAKKEEISSMIPPEQRPLFRQELELKGFEAVRIVPDGNCLFRALAYHTFEAQEVRHEEVRNLVCDELARDPDRRYSQYFATGEDEFNVDTSFEAYVTRMRCLEEWGGDHELNAAASKFNLEIHIHGFLNDSVIAYEVTDRPAKVVHLVYYGDHYDVALPITSELTKLAPGDEAGTSGVVNGGAKLVDGGGSVGVDGDVGDVGAGINGRYKPRGQGNTGRRLSSIVPDASKRSVRSRDHGQGLSKSAR